MGDEVGEQRRRSFAVVLRVQGAAVGVENQAGARWTARAEHCMPAADAEDRAAPSGTTPLAATAGDVWVHDYVWAAGAYREVLDMRRTSAGDGKILVLEGHGPWAMARPGTIYRPPALRSAPVTGTLAPGRQSEELIHVRTGRDGRWITGLCLLSGHRPAAGLLSIGTGSVPAGQVPA